MRKIVIASHGRFAQGVVDTVKFFAGDQNINALCAYVDEESLESKINHIVSALSEQDEMIVFTDLLGGSVNRAFLPCLKRKHTHLITGINLAVVLEIVSKQEDYLSGNELKAIVNEAQKQLVYMNDYEIMSSVDDE